VRPFDGDLDDYRDLLLKKEEKEERPAKPPAKPPARAARDPLVRGSKRNAKGVESRIKRIEETMAKLNARKASIESELGDPAVYSDAEKVRSLTLDQAYVAKELDQLESEWLELQC
jgi:ATP-binding cassette subfamily F protein 3